jgi:2-haloacid dehalogenase
MAFVSSNRWDVMGAVSFGFQAYWVNRAGAPDEYQDFPPQRRISNLEALLQT